MSDIFSSITQLGAIITEAMVKVLDRTVTVTTLLNAVTIPTVSSAVEVNSVKTTFAITITGVAIVRIEASHDGVNFLSLFPAVSSSLLLSDVAPWKFYRANLLSITSGAVTVSMATGA